MSDVRAAAERQYPVRYGYGRARYGGMLITDDSKDVWDVLHQCLEDHQMLSQAYLAIEAELAACRDEVERWQQLARAKPSDTGGERGVRAVATSDEANEKSI